MGFFGAPPKRPKTIFEAADMAPLGMTLIKLPFDPLAVDQIGRSLKINWLCVRRLLTSLLSASEYFHLIQILIQLTEIGKGNFIGAPAARLKLGLNTAVAQAGLAFAFKASDIFITPADLKSDWEEERAGAESDFGDAVINLSPYMNYLLRTRGEPLVKAYHTSMDVDECISAARLLITLSLPPETPCNPDDAALQLLRDCMHRLWEQSFVSFGLRKPDTRVLAAFKNNISSPMPSERQ